MSAGKLQRSTNGKRQRDTSNGKRKRNTATDTSCCCQCCWLEGEATFSGHNLPTCCTIQYDLGADKPTYVLKNISGSLNGTFPVTGVGVGCPDLFYEETSGPFSVEADFYVVSDSDTCTAPPACADWGTGSLRTQTRFKITVERGLSVFPVVVIWARVYVDIEFDDGGTPYTVRLFDSDIPGGASITVEGCSDIVLENELTANPCACDNSFAAGTDEMIGWAGEVLITQA